MDISEKMLGLGKKSSVIREIFEYSKRRKAEIGAENVYDFSIGNPSVPAPGIVNETMIRLLSEGDPVQLHGYTAASGDPAVRQKIADAINREFNAGARWDLIYMTCGAAASLTISLAAITEPGNEVLVIAPFFPEYRVFAEHAGAKLVPVPSRTDNFQLDLGAIEKSINENTKALIINSPNNPTGVIIPKEDLIRLSELLSAKEKEYGHVIYLIADEPYRKLVWNGEEVPYVPNYYADSLVCYSFSKAVSLPGERIGYILVSPTMKNAGDVYAAICGAGRALGFVCAPSLLQFTVAECVDATSDFSIYRKNRELLLRELTRIGYEVIPPDGAFYLFMKALEPDANAFYERGKEHELLLVPSDSFGCPGYVRIAYCVTTEQIERAIPAFEKLYEDYQK
ncbi:MAG: pyridoxal phosphate-dependent aminotransferase [Clostridia bacterium]|nr:pyridoxal phosphate-dependent aminotransferase [Clostridia bacterium]